MPRRSGSGVPHGTINPLRKRAHTGRSDGHIRQNPKDTIDPGSGGLLCRTGQSGWWLQDATELGTSGGLQAKVAGPERVPLAEHAERSGDAAGPKVPVEPKVPVAGPGPVRLAARRPIPTRYVQDGPVVRQAIRQRQQVPDAGTGRLRRPSAGQLLPRGMRRAKQQTGVPYHVRYKKTRQRAHVRRPG